MTNDKRTEITRYCSGCNRSSKNPLPKMTACCPDSKYEYVKFEDYDAERRRAEIAEKELVEIKSVLKKKHLRNLYYQMRSRLQEAEYANKVLKDACAYNESELELARKRLQEAEKELAKYQINPASVFEAVKTLCGSVDDFIKYHHNPIVNQKNEDIAKLEKEVERLRSEMFLLVESSRLVSEYKKMKHKIKELEARLEKHKAVVEVIKELRDEFERHPKDYRWSLTRINFALASLEGDKLKGGGE